MFDFDYTDGIAQPYGARMTVIGVGGGGGNAVNRMIDEKLQGVDFVVVNTDSQALKVNRAPTKIHIGKRLTRGLGAGARPDVGRAALQETAEEVQKSIHGADLVFVTCGMGGGTGTGAAPLIGAMAREMGALTIAIVTKPFLFEGKKRMRQAEQGLAEMKQAVDTVIVVPNERLLSVVGKGTSFKDALKKADEVLLNATQGISELIRVTGEVNVDFADVRTIMSNRGTALMGTGTGRGDNRAVEAAQEAISSPLLDNISINGASGVLINITGGMDLGIDEVTTISEIIQEAAGEEAEIIFGTVHDESMDGEIRVTVIATGLDEAIMDAASPTPRLSAPSPATRIQAPATHGFGPHSGHTAAPAEANRFAPAGQGAGYAPASAPQPPATPEREVLPLMPGARVVTPSRPNTAVRRDMNIPTFLRRNSED